MIYYILLASGLSRRFQGENKLFYQVEGLPMYRRALSCACRVREELKKEQGWDVQILVVTAYDEIAAEAEKAFSRSIINREPETGISRSIHLGLQAADPKEGDWILFSVCDQPWLKAGEVKHMILRTIYSGKGIGALSFRGDAGNPVIFRESFCGELKSLQGDRGGKAVLKNHQEDVILTEASSSAVLSDIDERPSGEGLYTDITASS